jgi:hypothetical protein
MEVTMTVLTVELPEMLAQQIQKRGISSQRLERMFIQFVQAYLHEHEAGSASATPTLFEGEAFARQIIANNRELFEELAHL